MGNSTSSGNNWAVSLGFCIVYIFKAGCDMIFGAANRSEYQEAVSFLKCPRCERRDHGICDIERICIKCCRCSRYPFASSQDNYCQHSPPFNRSIPQIHISKQPFQSSPPISQNIYC
ncbi:hypothetical protein Ddc_17208 [Ditylenchus destructor]|nr:hypothetical protein Ddc_17208 [Ditylenchus destructor]